MTAERSGPVGSLIGWLVSHRVAPNLIMLALIVGGLYMSTRITQEVFPEFEQDTIHVSVAYPGATPEQIEQGVVLPVEEAVRGVEGIARVRSTAHIGSGNVTLELVEGADLQRTAEEVERAVNGIATFADGAEDPNVDFSGWRREVLDVLVYGEAPDHTLRAAAEMVRDRIARLPGVTQAAVNGVRTHEIHIEIDDARLREYGLTLGEVGEAVANNSRDVSGGNVRTSSGGILLNIDARRTQAQALRDIVIQGSADGELVRLADIAKVDEAFSEMVGGHAEFNGRPAIGVNIFRVGDETPIGVSRAVREALPDIRADLPSVLDLSVHHDRSETYHERLDLLLTNGALGLLLVLVTLSLFLELKLAFWVTAGIPTAFLGAFLLLPGMGVSINMISLFAFIIALGIVVDDAIVAGENIYEYRSRGMGLVQSAVQGARDIAGPIFFSVLTNIVAFLPLALIPGHFGQLWAVIPAVVAAVFAISLIEALVILPTHLAYTHGRAGGRTPEETPPGADRRRGDPATGSLRGFTPMSGDGLDRVAPLAMTSRWGSSLGEAEAGQLVGSEWARQSGDRGPGRGQSPDPHAFEPASPDSTAGVSPCAHERADGGGPNRSTASLRPGYGPLALLHGAQVRCAAGLTWFAHSVYGPALATAMRWRYVTLAACLAALVIALAYPMSGKMGFNLMPSISSDSVAVTAAVPPGTPEEELESVRARLTQAAQQVIDASGGEALSEGVFSTASDTEARVTTYLTSADDRPITSAEFVSRWREAVGTIDGLAWMRFDSDQGGPGGGPSLTVGLSHPDVQTLKRASEVLAERLSGLEHVDDVDDGFSEGKPQWNIRVNEAGSALGLNAAMIGNQLRAGMFGTEAFRLLRGSNEVTVRVQLPESERSSRTDVSSFMLRTPEGHYVPLEEVATIERGEALTWISRRDGRRMGQVTANVTPPAQTNRVLATVRDELLPQMKRDFPQLSHSFEGQQETMRNAIDSFYKTVSLALLGIYALLALPFRSYVQPVIVMAAIPFGIVGAILGHLVMGYGLSLISVMGIIALGGVVVNGSLVMIDYANGRIRAGASVWEAAHAAGVRRFRPIFLTTVTTFGGLAPMIFEASVQAQFMIPMALSLGFGILFSSAILLFFVPCLYLALEDVKRLFSARAPMPDDRGVQTAA